MDVIFCRNVLMYFSTAQARKVVSQLHRSLVDDGWFFPSATEASAELFDKFTPLHFERTLAYRKRAAGLLENPQPPMARPAPAEAAPVKRPTPPVAARTPELSSETMLDLARQFANAGRFDEALATCDAALAANKLAPGHHYLRGLILEESGAHDEAVAALRRALFLDHDFVLAHFALGNLLRRRSREKDAARHFENTRALLMRYDSAATLPESDGLTAGRLLAILNTTREGAR
jgi:chemotaxis protein methyltransferase CheR